MEAEKDLGKRDGRTHRPLTDEEWERVKKYHPKLTFFEEDRTYISKAGNRVQATLLRNFTPKIDGDPSIPAQGTAKRTAARQNKIERYLEALGKGARISAACKASHLSYTAVGELRAKDPTFRQREKEAETRAAEPVEDALYDAATSGNVPAAVKWLEKRSAERWPSDKTIIETKATIEIDASDRIGSILALMAQLQQRAELGAGPDYIDVEAVEGE